MPAPQSCSATTLQCPTAPTPWALWVAIVVQQVCVVALVALLVRTYKEVQSSARERDADPRPCASAAAASNADSPAAAAAAAGAVWIAKSTLAVGKPRYPLRYHTEVENNHVTCGSFQAKDLLGPFTHCALCKGARQGRKQRAAGA